MKTVLVTDAETRNSLSVIRSLGKANYRVTTVSTKRCAMGHYSKYVYDSYTIKKYEEKAFLEIIKLVKPDIIFPCSDNTVEILSKSDYIKKEVICPVPSQNSFEICRDKYKTISFANSMGVRTPKTFSLNSKTDYEELKKTGNIVYPSILKPKKSSGSRGLRLCENEEELLSHFSKSLESFKDGFILQEFIPLDGDIIDAVFLYKEGKYIAGFVDKRVRTYPPKMGACTYGISIHNDEALNLGKKLLDKLEWNGLAMVEFRTHPKTGELYLMEINPRLWGSIQLPIFAGIDFPKILVDVFLNNYENKFETDYKDGLAMRWIGDYLSIIKSDKGLTKKMKLLFFHKKNNVTSQIADKSDPLPGIIFILNAIISIFNPKWWKKDILR